MVYLGLSAHKDVATAEYVSHEVLVACYVQRYPYVWFVPKLPCSKSSEHDFRSRLVWSIVIIIMSYNI